MGEALTRARLALVRAHWDGPLVDIGIGGGRFVEAAQCHGYDVNAEAVAWLRAQDRWVDPYAAPVPAITCWDSLEHIPQPEQLLAQVREWLFVALPVFEGVDDVLGSRHYKPGEHLWYWSRAGFIDWCGQHGFALVAHNQIETELGRAGIESFAFRRAER